MSSYIKTTALCGIVAVLLASGAILLCDAFVSWAAASVVVVLLLATGMAFFACVSGLLVIWRERRRLELCCR